jgi:replicative DNA helicase
MQKKEVVLIGAYSKVGKTDLICEIILHSIMRLKMNCVIFSMEMPREALIRRLLVKLFNTTRKGLTEMLQSPEGLTYIIKAREILEKYLLIVDTNNLTLTEVKYRVELANLYKFDKPVDRVFVDYFQYLKNTEEFTDIEATAKAMKPFVKDLNCELYMLSQFSRNDRPWERPSIASFKGGNAMESSFDKCLLLWRPSKNPKISEIDRKLIKYQTMIYIESREEMYGNDLFEMVYNPDTSRLMEKEEEETNE